MEASDLYFVIVLSIMGDVDCRYLRIYMENEVCFGIATSRTAHETCKLDWYHCKLRVPMACTDQKLFESQRCWRYGAAKCALLVMGTVVDGRLWCNLPIAWHLAS